MSNCSPGADIARPEWKNLVRMVDELVEDETYVVECKALGGCRYKKNLYLLKRSFVLHHVSTKKEWQESPKKHPSGEGNSNYYVRETKSAWTFFPPMQKLSSLSRST